MCATFSALGTLGWGINWRGDICPTMRTALDGGGHGRISKDLVHTLNRDGDAM